MIELGIGITIVVVAGLAMIWRMHFRVADQRLFIPVAMSLCLIGLSAGFYWQLGFPQYRAALVLDVANDEFADLSAKEINQRRIEEIQHKIREDKQNGESWYALGNAYMYVNEFDHAAVAFRYSARLAKQPQANIYSAQATALYYQNGQQLTEHIQALIEQALALDKDNLSALMLRASDYFLNARYQKAIDTWQQALDSERSDLDRVALISAINRAKPLVR